MRKTVIFRSILRSGIVAPSDEIVIGTQTWKLKNVADNIAGSKVYNNDEANRAIYGGLYTWNMIPTIEALHPGWHVPTNDEIITLYDYIRGTDLNLLLVGGRVKEAGTSHWLTPNTGADNSSGFALLPAGVEWSPGYYDKLGQWGTAWSKTTYLINPTMAYNIELYYNTASANNSVTSKTWGMSIRLIKD